jgi:hypothetical protein
VPKSVAAVDVGGGAAAVTSAERAGLKAADANVEPGTLMAELRHAQVDDIPVAEQHVHVWEPVGIVEHETVVYSPVSAMDHAVVTQKLAVRSCSCGALRRTEVGRKKRWLNR